MSGSDGGQSGRRRLMAAVLLALALCMALAGCDSSAQTPDLDATPSPGPQQQNLTYIGSDGNIWQLSIPLGSAAQMTSDASASASVSYSGLSWAPNGTHIAAIRQTLTGKETTDELVVLTDKGKLVMQAPLSGMPYDQRLIWSPNDGLIAYRELASNKTAMQLIVVRAGTGQLLRSHTYPFQQGCAQPSTALRSLIAQAHGSPSGVDTFAWSPDGKAILVSAGCADTTALRIDVARGTITHDYPGDATYQPKGRLILGAWSNGDATLSFGLSDADGAPLRAFVSAPAPATTRYPVTIGAATWSANGQTIYYEYDDSVWGIGADGRGAHVVQQGSALDAHHRVTVDFSPRSSANGQMLAYRELQGVDSGTGANVVTSQWYVLIPGDAQAAVLSDVTSEAVWQPDLCNCPAL